MNDTNWVKVIGGKHKGKTVRYVKRTTKRVGVNIEGKDVYLHPDHVENIETEQEPKPSYPEEDSKALTSNSMASPRPVSPIGQFDYHNMYTNWVKVIGGKHKGKTYRFVKRTEKRVAVEIGKGDIIYLLPDQVQNIEVPVGQELTPSHDKGDANALKSKGKVIPRPVSPAVISDNHIYTNWVKIVGGKHKGKTCQFIKRTEKRVAVNIEGKDIYLLPDHVKSIEKEITSQILQEAAPLKAVSMLDNEDSYDFVSAVVSLGDESDEYDNVEDDDGFFTAIAGANEKIFSPSLSILIQQGKHAGKKATFVKRTAKCIGVRLEGESNIRYLSPTSLDPAISNSALVDQNDPIVQAIRHHLPENISIQNVTGMTLKRTLFGIIFGEDNPVFFEVDTAAVSKLPQTFSHDGQTFHLAAVKMHNKAKSLTCVYMPSSSSENVANRLLHIGSFDKLVPRKTGARLELLLSTAAQDDHIHQIDASMFCRIPENGNVGCGFIPRDMIDLLIGTPSPQVCALQVRIVIPSMGIFKGILFEKQGIDKVELPPSMQKVEAAVNPDRNIAWLMINKTGIYPYPARVEQAENRFQDKRDFPIMALWMLSQKGVSQTYLQKPNGHHSNLLGVADPTDAIPPGCVFITGIHGTNQLDNFPHEVIISRFPMTEASDGRQLPLVREKPNTMTLEQWDFLCSKPFGIIVFGNPAPGDRPMPEQIAQGDLDGDGYFVTWDKAIVQDARIGDRAIFAAKNPPGSLSADWWSASQEYMANLEERKQSQKVIGRLHDCWLRNMERGLQHDAILFGRAFKAALVSAKHGGKVSLPARLCSQVPRDLHRFLLPLKAHV